MLASLFIDGYNYFDGFIFAGMFTVYLGLAVYEMKREKAKKMSYLDIQEKKGEGIVDHNLIEVKDHQHLPSKPFDKRIFKASLAFAG